MGSTNETIYEERLVRYLLGRMADPDRDGFEAEYFADDNLFQRLRECESWLIDQYLLDRLPDEERAQFEEQFSASLSGRNEVRLNKALLNLAERKTSPSNAPVTDPRSGIKKTFVLFEGIAPGSWLSAGVVIALVAGLGWLFVWNLQLRRTIQQLQASEQASKSNETGLSDRVRSADRQNSELGARLAQEEAKTARLQRGLAKAEEQINGARTLAGLASFLLIPDSLRLLDDLRVLKIPPTAKTVNLNLNLEPDDFLNYQAELLGPDKKVIWMKKEIAAKVNAHGKSIVLTIPTKSLANEEYSLRLSGLTRNGEVQEVARYSFKAVTR
ncbi:MAG: hypothetical protein ACREDR_20585 [Blastocatellia bacterium]